MNKLYKILVVSAVVLSFGFARTSGNFEVSDGFLERVKQTKEKPAFALLDKKDDGGDSLKWRRRHKRRKKAPNRRPQRGK